MSVSCNADPDILLRLLQLCDPNMYTRGHGEQTPATAVRQLKLAKSSSSGRWTMLPDPKQTQCLPKKMCTPLLRQLDRACDTHATAMAMLCITVGSCMPVLVRLTNCQELRLRWVPCYMRLLWTPRCRPSTDIHVGVDTHRS